MKKEISLELSPLQASSEQHYLPLAARKLGLSPGDITAVRILRKSVDARKRRIRVHMLCEVFAGELPAADHDYAFAYGNVTGKPEVIVAGAGPAGLFASLKLIELGYRPVLLERGKDVTQRRLDIDQLEKENLLNPESNYCFGEGGAGTFSDGKLYTRSKKKGDIGRVLENLVRHGAPANILYDAHPHIGSDILPHVITRIRQTITGAGGTIHFNTRITGMDITGDRLKHVITANGDKIVANALVLATGHSARDIYELLYAQGIEMEFKSFAMGVRVEHPQELIDNIQYHGQKDAYLPAASYSLVEQVNGRGVYSFCMCPGGQIVPASTGESEIVVNGMSLSARSSAFANAGIVVQVLPEDLRDFQQATVLAGLRLQESVEKEAYLRVQRGQTAPAQRLTDFLKGKGSADLPASSYVPGLSPSPMHEWLPQTMMTSLAGGFQRFESKMKGFLTREALVAGMESRTSSPVRITRDSQHGGHVRISNLFPAGEGAGYAGGIVSSAIDGERAAEHVARFLH